MYIWINFTFNGIFLLYLKMFYLRKFNGGNQTLKIDVVFS